MVPRRRLFGDFLRAVFSASRAQHVSDLRSKFTLGLRPHHTTLSSIASTSGRWSRKSVFSFGILSLTCVTRITCRPSANGKRRGPMELTIVTGSIARSATRRYLNYSEADFEVFRPAGVTRCTDEGEICHGVSSVPNFTPIGATIKV